MRNSVSVSTRARKSTVRVEPRGNILLDAIEAPIVLEPGARAASPASRATAAAMRAAILLLAATDARPHGADVAAFVRDRRRHLNATDEEGDSNFAGTYQCPEAGEAYSAAFLCKKAVFLKHLVPETRLHKGVGNCVEINQCVGCTR